MHGSVYGRFWGCRTKIGEEVLVFGKEKDDFIPIETIAKKTNTTTYVLLTAIHGRLNI